MRICNMNAIQIIDVFNDRLDSMGVKAYLLLQKNKKNSLINAYKNYSWKVWYIDDINNVRVKLYILEGSFRETTDAEKEQNTIHMEKNLLINLCILLSNVKVLNKMKDGSFKGNFNSN